MNDLFIISVYVIADDIMSNLDHSDHSLAQVSDSEVITVAVVAAKYFHNNQERALYVLSQLGYLSGNLSISRFNRRVHKLASWLRFLIETIGELLSTGEVYIIDSMPLPVCKRAKARRCRKVRGRAWLLCSQEGKVLWL